MYARWLHQRKPAPQRRGRLGEDSSSPSILADTIAQVIMVQVGHRCPAVKVERPTDERP